MRCRWAARNHGWTARDARHGQCEAFGATGAEAAGWGAGSQRPAKAASSDSAAANRIAAAKPRRKSAGDAVAPVAANAVSKAAMPNMAPRKRPMLKTPDALPISP